MKLDNTKLTSITVITDDDWMRILETIPVFAVRKYNDNAVVVQSVRYGINHQPIGKR